MESLESKLDMLSPEQRKEIEDFVDFLLARSGLAPFPPTTCCNPPPVLNIAPPPLTPVEPIRVGETGAVRLQDPVRSDERITPGGEDMPAPALFQEIDGGIRDRMTHDYIDYGQFEHPPSPATEAVKKVKKKIIAREEQEKPRKLLDWID